MKGSSHLPDLMWDSAAWAWEVIYCLYLVYVSKLKLPYCPRNKYREIQ